MFNVDEFYKTNLVSGTPFIYLVNGECLDVMSKIPDKSINFICTDLPYGRTKNKWDTVIDFNLLWKNYNRIIKDNGCIALFADGMFMSDLMQSNKKMWKYNLVWNKVLPSGFLNANRMPLRVHEEICIFYKNQPTYNPQKTKGNKNHSKGHSQKNTNNNYSKYDIVDNMELLGDMKHPKSILNFSKAHPSKSKHSTQKSLELLEYLIATFTNENDIVLDNTMGSGTTCFAAKNLNRNCIGIELNPKIYDNVVQDFIDYESTIKKETIKKLF